MYGNAPLRQGRRPRLREEGEERRTARAQDAEAEGRRPGRRRDGRTAAHGERHTRRSTVCPPTTGTARSLWTGRQGRTRHTAISGSSGRAPTYPVMTAKETLEQLNKQGATGSAGAGSGTVREPAPDDVAGDDVRQGAGKLPGKAAKRKPVKVTDAEFGLVTRYTVRQARARTVVDLQGAAPGRCEHGERRAPGGAARVPQARAVGAAGRGPGRRLDTGSGQGGGSDPGTGSGSGQAEEPGSAPAQAVNSYEADGRTAETDLLGRRVRQLQGERRGVREDGEDHRPRRRTPTRRRSASRWPSSRRSRSSWTRHSATARSWTRRTAKLCRAQVSALRAGQR